MATIGRPITPDVPGVGTQFGGGEEHMAHHRNLETVVEALAVTLPDIYTKPTLSITTTTVGSLIISLSAAGIITSAT